MIKTILYSIIAITLSACAVQPYAEEINIDVTSKNQTQYDTTSIPHGVLSQGMIERQWNAYKTSSQCLSHNGIESAAIKVLKLSDESLEKNTWNNIFIKTEKEQSCQIEVSMAKLSPLVALNPGPNYGDRQLSIDIANYWLYKQSSLVRYSRSMEEKVKLKTTILDWAQQNALNKGIDEPGRKFLDWQITTLIISLLTATGEVAEDFTPEERVIVGKWLNQLMIKVGQQQFQYSSHNKEYLRAYTLLLWALMIDDVKLTQKVIDIYKNAIHEMRPDGSFPNDSQRGGMGLDYNSKSASSLVLIASLLKQKKNIDLFSYEVDGRSIHNAVEHVVFSIKEPSVANKKYAIRCPDAGDRWGSVEDPNISHQNKSSGGIAGFLLVYASIFPERDSSKFIENKYGVRRNLLFSSFGEIAGGAPTCQFKF